MWIQEYLHLQLTATTMLSLLDRFWSEVVNECRAEFFTTSTTRR